MTSGIDIQTLDKWITGLDGPVALHLKQQLQPVEDSRIIFPPTYADIGYNLDTLSDGTRVATVDSVGSQANRLEPNFLSASKNAKDWLVPQIEVMVGTRPCGKCATCKGTSAPTKGKKKEPCSNPREVTRSLLDLAHRATDAVVQSSPDLKGLVEPAIRDLQTGDAGLMCAIAPTSLVFGFWDSRGSTGEKRPRLVRSTIRAWDVEPLHAAAQFNSVWKVLDEGQQGELEKEAKESKKELSVIGFKDAPATFRKTKVRPYLDGSPNPEARVLGGVLVRGRIEREVVVNLVALRALRGKNADGTDATAAIRKYILGLSLVAASADIELFLREGCLLRYADTKDQWHVVPRRGEPQAVTLDPKVVEQYAHESAAHFRAKWPEVFGDRWPKDPHQAPDLKYAFSLDAAKKLISKGAPEEEATQG